MNERAVAFGDGADRRIGVIAGADGGGRVAVLLVPAGAQNRCGSGRRYVRLARSLAGHGVTSLRFDYAGMGDSPGELPHFESAGTDIGLAIDALLRACPSARGVVAWGLCDGATAALLRAATDPRIVGVVGLNPWARTEAGRSAAIVRTYYGGQLRSPDFWSRLLRGRIALVPALRSALAHLIESMRPAGSRSADALVEAPLARRLDDRSRPLPDRLEDALRARDVPMLAIVGRSDLTGTEFHASMQAKGLFGSGRIAVLELEHGDHSLSREQDWLQAVEATRRFIESCSGGATAAP